MTKRPLPNPIFPAETKLLLVTLESTERVLHDFCTTSRTRNIVCDVSVGLLHKYDATERADGKVLFPLIVRPFGGPLSFHAPASSITMHEAENGAPLLVASGFVTDKLRGGTLLITPDRDDIYARLTSDYKLHGPSAVYVHLRAIDDAVRAVTASIVSTALQPFLRS